MEEIDLKELLKFFKSKLCLFIVILVGVCLIGCVYGLFIQKPMYSSDTTVILGSNETITQTDVTLNKNLVNTYAQIVKSRRILLKVIDKLSLKISYDQLAGKISVSPIENTEMIKINVNDADAILAKNIANVTANVFVEEVSSLYKMDNVFVLDEAITANKPYNINVFKQVIVYFILGLALASGVLFIIYYFDRTLKSIEQVEQKIMLPILGSVQDISKGGK